MKVTVTIEEKDEDVKDLIRQLISEMSWSFLKQISEK